MRICALPALWVGLFYSSSALDGAWDLIEDFSAEEHAYLRAEAPRQALQTPFRGGTLLDLARQVVDLAQAGLKDRARIDASGADERGYLDDLHTILKAGRSPAADMLERFHGPWKGDIDRVFDEFSS